MRVAQLALQLDHPDVPTQNEAIEALVALGPEAIPEIVANFDFVSARARRGLVTALEKLQSPRALGGLMRFVWDKRGSIEDADTRALAMKAIAELAQPEHAPRLLSFLLDIAQDEDPFVRGWAADTLGRFGDPRAQALLKSYLKDPSDVVRERAQLALMRLKDLPNTDALKPDLSDAELLKTIRGSKGAEQTYWFDELRSRENAFELAAQLAREPGRTQVLGLHYLQESRDARARGLAVHLLMREPESPHRAIALRIIAQHLNRDADADETALIRSGLYDTDSFVKGAAFEAAGRSGVADLIDRAIDALSDRDPEFVHAAARGLSRGLAESERHLFPRLSDAFETLHRRRLNQNDDLSARCEAYLLRAFGRVIGTTTAGADTARHAALRALFDAEAHQPVLITALDLLEQTTPAEGLPEAQRWPAERVRDLAMLLGHPERDVRMRVLSLITRGAAAGNDTLVPAMERLLYESPTTIQEQVIPVLEHVGTTRARALLTELTNDARPEVSTAANAALTRWRNAQPWIEAEFDDSF